MLLAPARPGEPLKVMQREIEFSFFPMRRTRRRWGIHSMLYAAEPWAVIDGSLGRMPAGPSRKAAQSFVRQAREYFTAAERADTIETRPLLYYYSFLNVGKALGLARGRPGLVGRVLHGIAPVVGTGHAPSTAELIMSRSTGSKVNALDELHVALDGTQVPTGAVAVREVTAQSVVAHRLWLEATSRKERFLTAEHVRILNDPSAKTIWATIEARADTMRAHNRGVAETVREASLAPNFRAVAVLKARPRHSPPGLYGRPPERNNSRNPST